MKYQLEINNITKSYGDLKANDDVSLNIKPQVFMHYWERMELESRP